MNKKIIYPGLIVSFLTLGLAPIISESVNYVVVKTGNAEKVRHFKPLLTPTDPLYTQQQYISMNHVGDIEKTWDRYTGEGTVVAVIDTGIEANHEDFVGHVSSYSASFETVWASEDPDETEYEVRTEQVSGNDYSCLSHDWDSEYREWSTHGSNVAGSAAALMNGVGTVGIAPGATIMALKIDFYDPSINAAIEWATDHGADVINMSLGAYTKDFTDGLGNYQQGWADAATMNEDAINYAHEHGVIVIAAAGNECTSEKSYPACNDHVIGVGALEKNSSTEEAYFSNFNSNSDTATSNNNVDVMAPGYVYAPGAYGTKTSKTLGYDETAGTSFASPIVAGAACLWKEKHPEGTPDEFYQKLISSTKDMGSTGWDKQYGYGSLDVCALLDADKGVYIDSQDIVTNTSVSSITLNAHTENLITSWESSDTNVATVTPGSAVTGDVTATVNLTGTVGSTTITVTDSENNLDSITITVNQYVAATSIETTLEDGAEIPQGKSVSIGASVLPSNASYKDITYSVSEGNTYAMVSSEGVIKGLKESGDNTVTIHMEQADGITKDLSVKITKSITEVFDIVFSSASTDSNRESDDILSLIESGSDAIKSITGSKIYASQNGIKMGSSSNVGSLTIKLKESYSLTQIILNAKKYNKDTGELVVNNKTASEGSLGSSLSDLTFTLDGDETDTITITTTSKRAYLKSISITAGPIPPVAVTGVSLNSSSLNLKIGDTSTLTATVLPAKADNKQVTWSSNNESVATVDQNGKVTAIGVGSTSVIVTTVDGGFTASCTVNVTKYNSSDFAQDLLTKTNPICSGNEANRATALEALWSGELLTLFNSLDDEEKQALANATANKDSSNFIEAAMARYDRIVEKYELTDFIGRSNELQPSSAINHKGAFIVSPIIIASVIISAIGVISLYIVKKKKHS